jgi:hypothetical protein
MKGEDMDWSEGLWGAVVIGAGMFLAVYGSLLFKFALAFMGFGVGFIGAWWLLDDQDEAMRVLIALVAGGVAAVLLFSLVRFGLYIAGAILGAVLAFVVGGIIDILGPTPDRWLMIILLIGGIGGGGFFGNRLGNWIIILATAAAGAFMVVDGIQLWFASRIAGEIDDPTRTLGQKLTMVVFLVIFGIAALSQNESSKLRRRIRT